MLLLDNCEHLLGACSALAEALLGRCPHVHILATSRQPLGIPAEVVQPVLPLDVPPVDAPEEHLLDYAAGQLFLERARSAAPHLRLGPEDARHIGAICRQLEGLPLALELAAARVRGLAPMDLATHLDAPLNVLRAPGRSRPRQASLRAAIDWSYALLEPEQRVVLRQLSVFSGGWTLRAVEAVCGAATTYELAHLIDHSLVQFDARDPIAPRYRLLETVRQYAFEQLTRAEEVSDVAGRHLDYFVTFAEQAERGLDGAEPASWLRVLDAESANVRVACQSALDRGDAQSALRLVGAMASYWDMRGQRSAGLAFARSALTLMPRGASRARAKALRGAGRRRLPRAMRSASSGSRIASR